jgi:uncharacterized protein YxjI
MKKYLMFTMLIAMMVCLLAVPGHIEAAPDVSVKVDGQYVSFPDQKPYIDSANRTMVPVRAPMEKMGCTVEWNDKTRQATITKGDKTAVFTIDKNTYTVNGQTKTMDTKAVITNNRTAFPIRFAAEAMGAKVDWDANTYTVLITTVQAPKIQPIEGVKHTTPYMEGYVESIYVTKWTPEKIENACAVFASETALAEEMKEYIMESYNSNTPMLKTFYMSDGRNVTVATPRGSKDFVLTIRD